MQKPSNQRDLSRKGLCKGRVPAFTIDTRVTLEKMLKRYAKSGRAQNVSFRRLVHWIKVGERATHYLHSYPAKLLPQIAHFFIASSGLTKEGDAILDPFGGTGTVALESLLAKRRALYADANPLAQLIARVKTTPLTSEQLHRGVALFKKYHSQSPRHIADAPDVVNLYHWYSQTAVQELSRIKRAISRIRDALVREFLLVSFSSTCRKVSFADPRLSVPVRLQEADLKAHRSGKNVWEVFTAQVEDNLHRYARLNEMRPNVFPLRFVGDDARRLLQPGDFSTHQSRRLRANSVPMVVTSPPYAGAQKYVRASSLNLGWLGLAGVADLKPLENASIGREHLSKNVYDTRLSTGVDAADRLINRVFKQNKLRSAIVATYLNEMRVALQEIYRVLRPGGHLVLVIGNNEVCGLPFKSSEYLANICQELGLLVRLRLIDEIKSRGLMTKRNKTAGVIAREWVILFEKPIPKKY